LIAAEGLLDRNNLLPERKRQFSQPSLDPIRLDVRKILAVDPRRPMSI
jgi:hypothetical protein